MSEVKKTELTLEWFITQEKKNVKYCRLGCIDDWDYPGKKYFVIGEICKCRKSKITFEPADVLLNYSPSKFDTNIIVFNFEKQKEIDINNNFSSENNSNAKGCYKANELYVEDIIPLNDVKAVDFIIAHLNNLPDSFDSWLARLYDLKEDYYPVLKYFEEQLLKHFPSHYQKHTVTGTVDNRGNSSNQIKSPVTLEIDYIEYENLRKRQQEDLTTLAQGEKVTQPYIIHGLHFTKIDLDKNNHIR